MTHIPLIHMESLKIKFLNKEHMSLRVIRDDLIINQKNIFQYVECYTLLSTV